MERISLVLLLRLIRTMSFHERNQPFEPNKLEPVINLEPDWNLTGT